MGKMGTEGTATEAGMGAFLDFRGAFSGKVLSCPFNAAASLALLEGLPRFLRWASVQV